MEISTLRWRRSSSCANGADCVEVALSEKVWVRNSSCPEHAVLSLSQGSWHAFVSFVKESSAIDENA
ncbi:DUF397 domain-containing protein [Streptomyces sp. NPDC056627]|uniref:DUF397 domain-containing protein n=1 Tax=Streptomyces sp. NPDC056627 TaxID=3345881 RepID=UPI0009399B91